MLLAGDIDRTKTELAIFSPEGGPHAPRTQGRVHIANHSSLQAIVKEFASQAKEPIDRACFAVAGPVIGGRVNAPGTELGESCLTWNGTRYVA